MDQIKTQKPAAGRDAARCAGITFLSLENAEERSFLSYQKLVRLAHSNEYAKCRDWLRLIQLSGRIHTGREVGKSYICLWLQGSAELGTVLSCRFITAEVHVCNLLLEL
jgi:hypothetical protein